MLYVLKRKDEVITLIDFLEDGSVYQFHQDSVNPELAPLHNPDDHDWLKQWWKRRSVPISQGNIRSMLEKKGRELSVAKSGIVIDGLLLDITDGFRHDMERCKFIC